MNASVSRMMWSLTIGAPDESITKDVICAVNIRRLNSQLAMSSVLFVDEILESNADDHLSIVETEINGSILIPPGAIDPVCILIVHSCTKLLPNFGDQVLTKI